MSELNFLSCHVRPRPGTQHCVKNSQTLLSWTSNKKWRNVHKPRTTLSNHKSHAKTILCVSTGISQKYFARNDWPWILNYTLLHVDWRKYSSKFHRKRNSFDVSVIFCLNVRSIESWWSPIGNILRKIPNVSKNINLYAMIIWLQCMDCKVQKIL